VSRNIRVNGLTRIEVKIEVVTVTVTATVPVGRLPVTVRAAGAAGGPPLSGHRGAWHCQPARRARPGGPPSLAARTVMSHRDGAVACRTRLYAVMSHGGGLQLA
jgi:hypothetical protein